MTRDEIQKPENEARFLAIPDWQARILDERLADLDRNPDDEQTWDEVKSEIRFSLASQPPSPHPGGSAT